MLNIKCFYFNPFQECCTVASDGSSEAVIVDPGCYSEAELAAVKDYVRENGLKPVKIVLTHGHFDHIFGVSALASHYGINVLMNKADTVILDNNRFFCGQFGLDVPDTSFARERTEYISDGDTFEWGDGRKWEVIATPGHTPGGVCLLDREAKLLLSGDTLFAGSIGRTDNEWGDYDALIRGILEKIIVLDGDITVIPGHGPHTTVADESMKNPFLLPFNEPYGD